MSDEVTPEDFQAILAQLREWVRTKVVPREREIADADAIPDDLRKQAADMGLFGYAIPQDHGGLGLDLTQDVELAMELGYTSLAVRSMFGTNNGIAGQVLVNFGTDEQQAAWLGRLASGEVVASFALTEPGAGSNPAGLQTRAVRDGDDPADDWVIDGQKRFITNAPSADLFVVFARTRPADESGTGIAVFLVPADAPGVEVGAKDRKMGQEGAWTSDVVFSDVRVPASALVGGDVDADAGYRAAMTSLARGRVHMAALAVGTAQRALDESVAYAASATQGGTVIGDFQLVQAMIADQQTGVLAGRALVRETAARYVSGEDRRIGPSAAKLFCTEMAGQVADLAVQIHGGSGYMRDMPVERIYRDVRLLRLYEGTSEIQRLIIGGGLVRAQQRRLGLDERQQVRVEYVGVRGQHPVGEAGIGLQRAVPHQFDGAGTRTVVGDDLVAVAVHGEDGHGDLLQVFAVVLTDEFGDALVLTLSAAHHALTPPVRDDRLRRLHARLVEVVERPGGHRPVELRAVRRPPRLQALEGGLGHAGRVGVGLQDRRGHRADQDHLRHPRLAVAAEVARHLPAAGRVPDVDGVMQVKVLDQVGQVVGVVVHVVALADLCRAAVPAAVVGDHPIAMVQEEKHLGVPVVSRQGPPVAEDDRLTGTPVLEVDLSSVSGREVRHGVPLCSSG